MLNVRQIIASWENMRYAESLLFKAVKPQVLAQSNFRCQLPIAREMVIKLIRFQLWWSPFQIFNIKQNVKLSLFIGTLLTKKVPFKLFSCPSNIRLSIPWLANNFSLIWLDNPDNLRRGDKWACPLFNSFKRPFIFPLSSLLRSQSPPISIEIDFRSLLALLISRLLSFVLVTRSWCLGHCVPFDCVRGRVLTLFTFTLQIYCNFSILRFSGCLRCLMSMLILSSLSLCIERRVDQIW